MRKTYKDQVICNDEKVMVDLIEEKCMDILSKTKYEGHIAT